MKVNMNGILKEIITGQRGDEEPTITTIKDHGKIVVVFERDGGFHTLTITAYKDKRGLVVIDTMDCPDMDIETIRRCVI